MLHGEMHCLTYSEACLCASHCQSAQEKIEQCKKHVVENNDFFSQAL